MKEMVNLLTNERIDVLYKNNIKIIQSDEVFSFSLDAVLLADFINPPKKGTGTLVDLGSGNGAISLFIANKIKGNIISVEIQKKLADMAKRSVELNDLDHKIEILNKDMKDIFNEIPKGSIDTVVSNPPYFKIETETKKNLSEYKAIARHEIKADLELVIKTASSLLKNKGHFYLVHRPDRLIEIITTLNKYEIAPKKIKFIYPKKGMDANVVLIEGIKKGKLTGLKILESIITHNEDNTYTKEIITMYKGI